MKVTLNDIDFEFTEKQTDPEWSENTLDTNAWISSEMVYVKINKLREEQGKQI